MQSIASLADELWRRQQIRARLDGDQLAIPLKGEEVVLALDEEFERFILWGEIVDVRDEDFDAAAILSLQFNDEFSYARAVTLGVSKAAGKAILGRSFEAPDLESGRLLREAEQVGSEIQAAKAWMAERLAQAKSRGDGGRSEDFIRI